MKVMWYVLEGFRMAVASGKCLWIIDSIGKDSFELTPIFLPGNIVVNLRDAHVLYLVFGSRRHFIVVEYIYMLSNQSNILRA